MKRIPNLFTPNTKFVVYYIGTSFCALSIFGSFGLFDTDFLSRSLLTLGYTLVSFIAFWVTMTIMTKKVNTWTTWIWLAWLVISLLISSPINLYVHDLVFIQEDYSFIRVLTMASYMLFLFLFSAITYGLLKKKKNSESKSGGSTTKLRVPAENPKNDLILDISAFFFAQSAGNYLEVYCTSREGIEKKLIRTTIKKLVKQVEAHKDLMQCHQSFIVNLSKVKQVKGNSQNRYLVLKEELENVPVSRRFSKTILDAFNQKSQNLTEYP